MTPDQAATLIRAAWEPFTGDDFSLSNRIALALDALGLLHFASDPQQPRRGAELQQPTDEGLRGGPDAANWATTRQRILAGSLAEQHPGATLQDIHSRAKGEP